MFVYMDPNIHSWLDSCACVYVCVIGLRSRARFERDKTRLELISRIGGTGTRLMFSVLVTQENSEKIPGINWLGIVLKYQVKHLAGNREKINPSTLS